MKTVRILLWQYHKQDIWYRDIVSKCIVFFTGMNATHVAVGFEDNTKYESAVWYDEKGNFVHGARRTKIDSMHDLEIPISVTNVQAARMVAYLEKTIKKERPYNFVKLFVLAIVYPTRWFWNKINWVPFDNEYFGEVCSTYVDQAFRAVGKDLFPGHDEGYTVPGNFLALM